MKSFSLVFCLVFLLLSNVISARLISSWSDRSYTPSYYLGRSRQSNVEIIDCSDDTYVLQIKSIKISPDIIVPGGEVTIEASGTLLKTVYPGAEAHVTVKLGAVTLLRKTFDLCDELDKKKDEIALQCPINEGDLTILQKITLPKEIPKAKFTVAVQAYTVDEDDLACLRIRLYYLK